MNYIKNAYIVLLSCVSITFMGTSFDPRALFKRMYQDQQNEPICPCSVPHLEGEVPDMVCVIAKQIRRLRHYGDHQDEYPNFFMFYGKDGSGKKTAARWAVQEGGGTEMLIHPQQILDTPACISGLYDQAIEVAKNKNRPTVIIFEHPRSYNMSKEDIGWWETYMFQTAMMWNDHKANPYVTTIYLYPDFSTLKRGDILSRSSGVEWKMPDAQRRKEVITKHLPEGHKLSSFGFKRFVWLTAGFSVGEILQMIDQAKAMAQEQNIPLDDYCITNTLNSALWNEYYIPRQTTVLAGTTVVTSILVWLVTRKYHDKWLQVLQEWINKLKVSEPPSSIPPVSSPSSAPSSPTVPVTAQAPGSSGSLSSPPSVAALKK